MEAQYPEEGADIARLSPDSDSCCLSKSLRSEFEAQSDRLAKRARLRRDAVQLRSVAIDREERDQTSEADLLGRRQPQDEYQGDVNLRTLRSLLKRIDENGFERSPHQVPRGRRPTPFMRCNTDIMSCLWQIKFHSAFERSTARVIYKDVRACAYHARYCSLLTQRHAWLQDWGTQRPAIMAKNKWASCSSEVLIR